MLCKQASLISAQLPAFENRIIPCVLLTRPHSVILQCVLPGQFNIVWDGVLYMGIKYTADYRGTEVDRITEPQYFAILGLILCINSAEWSNFFLPSGQEYLSH